jgi:hypothetical protein
MKRLRWLEVEMPFSIRTFGNKLKKLAFTSELSEGFIVDRIRDTYLEARYVEKIPIHEVGQDPLGNEYVFERVDYRQTEFRVSKDYPHLELANAPRGIQGFTSRLTEIGDFALSISGIETDVLRWAEKLNKVFPDQFMVDLAQASGLVIEDNVTARVIINGTVDVRGALDRFTSKSRPGVDRLQIRFNRGHEVARAILFSDGAARVINDPTQELAPMLRKTLAEI